MFFVMLVGLYTSRIVLNTLGVVDYGIYGVVGGVVAMLGFINASMSSATSRFLAYELGRQKKHNEFQSQSGIESEKRRFSVFEETFSSALIIHIGIAIIVFLIAETAGLWFLNNKLVIPIDRMDAARWVYQLSIASTMLGITQVPYNATIIAHEKMDVYAYVEILHATLKLMIVYLLTIGHFDKLKLYAILVFLVSVLIITIYKFYCLIHFHETRFHLIWKTSILKPMLTFSAQTITAHMSYSIRQQGTNFSLNMIFGVIVNAANGIATTIAGIASTFASNINIAFQPQITKNYSQGNLFQTNNLIMNASIYSTLLLLLIVIPLEFETPYILRLWLGDVPEYTTQFCRILLLTLFTSLTKPVYTGIAATGRIKTISYIQSLLYIACPIITYYLCIYYKYPIIGYIVILVAQYLVSGCILIIYKHQVNSFSIRKFFNRVFYNIIIPITISIFLCYYVHQYHSPNFLRLVVITIINTFVICCFTYLLMNKIERQKIRRHLKHLIQ